jgi:glycolate oxidase
VTIESVDMLSRLRDRLGDALLLGDAALEAVRSDRSGHVSGRRPLAVVEARTIEHVQETMRFASAHRIPVVPRGAGTGLAGAAIGDAGEIVLSTRTMDALVEVSVDDELAVVQPGIINAELNAQLAEHGLWWAPDPASRAISTVGGNIATNAGGLLCAKYGVTREAVLGLRVVLADGTLMTFGHRTVKGVTGYDLTALMIGSEGTLGVIVEATLKLRTLPRGGVATIAARFDDVERAARAASVITARGLRPSILELLDRRAVAGIAEHLERRGVVPAIRTDGVALLAQTDGEGAAAEAEAVLAVIRGLGGDAVLTEDREEGERMFALRRAFHPAMEERGTVLIEDVSVPRSALPAMFAAIERIEAETGLEIPTVAHAGDGNLHPNFVFEAEHDAHGRPVVPEAVWDAADRLFQTALRLGGTLTGEHGVGILKRRWLADELGEPQVELQRRLKAAFDPLGILNPGKVLGGDGPSPTPGE